MLVSWWSGHVQSPRKLSIITSQYHVKTKHCKSSWLREQQIKINWIIHMPTCLNKIPSYCWRYPRSACCFSLLPLAIMKKENYLRGSKMENREESVECVLKTNLIKNLASLYQLSNTQAFPCCQVCECAWVNEGTKWTGPHDNFRSVLLKNLN